MTNNILCKRTEDIVAYLQNELTPGQKAQFTEHLAHCSTCSVMLADYQRLLKRLKEEPAEIPRRDLADKVLAQVTIRPYQRQKRLRWVATAASILIGITLGLLILSHRSSETTTAVTQALDWLARNQDATGKWSVEKWGGHKQYEIATSALSIMALAGSESTQREKYMPNIQKGINYLLRQQSPNGRFGPRFSVSLYNHGIATVCLLEVYALMNLPCRQIGEQRLQKPIKSALNYIQRTQTPQGGWGYLDIPNESPNTAVSCWMLQALLWAESMEFGKVTLSLEKGFQWLAQVSDELGRPGYRAVGDFPYGPETLSVMAAFCYTYGGTKYLTHTGKYQRLMDLIYQGLLTSKEIDYYRSYFLVYLEHPSLIQYYDDLIEALSRNQAHNNTLAGSWGATDQWGQVGGRIYSTALAALILEVSTRGPWLKSYFKP